ncbi:MAG: glutamate--tRNA ligase [Nitrososphaerota archaeon]
MSDTNEIFKSAYKWALKNAYDHSGKAIDRAVISKVIAEMPWAKSDIQTLKSEVERAVQLVNSMSIEEIEHALTELDPKLLEKKRGEEEKRALPPLPGAVKGAVVTRLPPEPSGYMHIGHALSGLINYLYKEMYDGKLWLRFEDTDPRKAKAEYYDSFRDGYTWLGIKWDYEKNNSDDIPLMYEYAERLISQGKAYACLCRQEELRKKRALGEACIHRSMSRDWSLEQWDRMLSGHYREGEISIRLMGDLKSMNTALRDPVLLRIVNHPHPLCGEKYLVWPTYDFAVSIEDALCGVTHVLRTSEFMFRDELQDMIRRYLGLPNPVYVEYSRFEFEGTPVAKREIRELITSGLVKGWDDPRLATIMAVRRRGILPEALREFVLRYTALTTTKKEYSWDLLYAINRRIIDSAAPRLFFVPEPVKLVLSGLGGKVIEAPLHPTSDLGKRKLQVSSQLYVPRRDAEKFNVGDKFRLKYLANCRVIEKGEDYILAEAREGEPEPGIEIIQWAPEDSHEIRIIIPGQLFRNEEFQVDSLKTVTGLVEPYEAGIKIGMRVQFERFGYCIKDPEPKTYIFIHQ